MNAVLPRKGVWAFVDKKDLDKAKLQELLDNYGLLADDKIVGYSLLLLKCLREARRRARIPNENILILGESGTGKELLAKYIRQQSGREGEYVSFSQVREDILEDELSKAAESADGGTLFIDNFGDISATFHVKLPQILRNICNRDIQVITAIERAEVLYEDNFRKSLPDGIQIHNYIQIPPLSQRLEDIPLLVDYFVKKYEEESRDQQRQVSDEAIEVLRTYPWPDNVRELENVIKYAVSTYKELRWLEADHLTLSPHEAHIPPTPSIQPDSSDLFEIILQDDPWKQLRESIGEMAIWLQDMAIWIHTERALRRAIEVILIARIGSDWIKSECETNHILRRIFEDCKSKRKKHLRDYPGDHSEEPGLINFTKPSDLFNIILHANLWDHFREFFGKNDPVRDHYWQNIHWTERKNTIVNRVRHLMNHSNPDLIRSYDRYTFKGYCGEILEICRKIKTVAAEQEELYKGTVTSLAPDDTWAIIEIDDHPDLGLSLKQMPKDQYKEAKYPKVPWDNFKDTNAFAQHKKVKFKVKRMDPDFGVYDVSLA